VIGTEFFLTESKYCNSLDKLMAELSHSWF